MASKERPLTAKQIETILATEPTLYGDMKMVLGHGRTLRGLKNRGLIEGEKPHVYLSEKGKQELSRLVG
jgi:hypothetical protein